MHDIQDDVPAVAVPLSFGNREASLSRTALAQRKAGAACARMHAYSRVPWGGSPYQGLLLKRTTWGDASEMRRAAISHLRSRSVVICWRLSPPAPAALQVSRPDAYGKHSQPGNARYLEPDGIVGDMHPEKNNISSKSPHNDAHIQDLQRVRISIWPCLLNPNPLTLWNDAEGRCSLLCAAPRCSFLPSHAAQWCTCTCSAPHIAL
jgi:hypothetical protein